MSPGPPPVPGGRSPEEREAARRERESRRAGRNGPADGDGAGKAAAPPPRKDWLAEARRLTGGSREHGNGAAGKAREAPARETPSQEAPAREATPPREERPAPAVRRDHLQGLRERTAQMGASPGRVRAGRLVVVAAVVVVAVAGLWFVLSLYQPFKGDGEGEDIRVAIPRGASVGQIGDLLEQREVISSSFFFQTRARFSGRSSELKPGSYRLKRDMSHAAALDAVEKGTPPDIVVLTIPEGRSRREVARAVGDQLDGNYVKETLRSRVLDPSEYGARRARNLEGFLFPATYELKKGRPMSALVEQQLSAFRQKFEGVGLGYARSKNLTPYEVLVIASLVEREAQLEKERPIVASVIYNRMREGIPLGIDATVRFITGNWERPLRKSELANPSPYNTRRNRGLPPGPIGSPGLASIKAAARPARTKFLFYVVKPGSCGEHKFSATDAEFQRDVARYNSERAKRGGKSPTNC